ncbi:luciferase family protein [Mycobacterium tuberculosis]|nr:luciferase family protein [Mycobacterium tuberculosis]
MRMREYVLALRAIWSAWETGERLSFEGEFYTHTLMAPMFTPPSHGHGTPPVLIAGVGEQMTVVAGEVGDGMLVHSFVTEKYVRERTMPALARGRAKSTRQDFETVGAPFVATGNSREEIDAALDAVRHQVAFYASTPAYRPVLETHGWGAIGDRLHGLTRVGDWKGLASALPDDVLAEFVVIGGPEDAADALWKRYGTLFDRYTILTPYELDGEVRLRLANRLREHL